MTHYIYPQNLKATANMWLWSLRDFAIMGVAALISIVILVELHLMLPAAATLWPAIPTIAAELKLSQSTVRRALRDLRKAGLLETEQRYRTKGGKSSLLYKIQRR